VSLTSTTWHSTQASPIGVLRAATAVRRTVGGHGKTDNHQETRSTAMTNTMIEMQARHQIQERVAQASAPRLPSRNRRHRVAEQLRRVADRVDT
jgi:hypothetical protein